MWVGGRKLWWLIGFYGGLAVLTAFPRIRPPRRWCVALLAVWIAAGMGASVWTAPGGRSSTDDELRCTFLAVGHGTPVVMELLGGQTMLYDASRLGSAGGRCCIPGNW